MTDAPLTLPQRVADKLLGIDLTRYTYRVLDCSTSMIPEHTAAALGHTRNCEQCELWDILPYEPWAEYGWIINCGGDYTSPNDCMAKHPELDALLKFASERGFAYVRLDCDGAELPEGCGLPVFSW